MYLFGISAELRWFFIICLIFLKVSAFAIKSAILMILDLEHLLSARIWVVSQIPSDQESLWSQNLPPTMSVALGCSLSVPKKIKAAPPTKTVVVYFILGLLGTNAFVIASNANKTKACDWQHNGRLSHDPRGSFRENTQAHNHLGVKK